MADDRKKRPHRDHGYPRPSSSVPVEIDPELTPPPREPPTAEAFSALPLTAKVDALHHVQQGHAAGFERIWEVRHVSAEIKAQTQRLERLETIVAQDTRQVTELIAKVHHWGDVSQKAFDRSQTLNDKQIRLDERLAVFFDEQFPELVGEIKTLGRLSTRISDAESEIERIAKEQNRHTAALAILDTRISIVERKDEDKALVATAEQAQVRRLINKANAVKALIAAAIAVAGVLAGMNL